MISTLVRADQLWLASLFQSKEETRYQINGVFVTQRSDDLHVVGTDGHRLALFHDVRGHTMVPCIIPLPADCRSAIKKAKNREFLWFGIVGEHNGRGRHVARVLDAGEPNMGEADNIEERLDNPLDTGIIWSGAVDLIDGTFPNYVKAIPERRALRGVSAFLDQKLLADFGVVAGDLMRKGAAPLRMFSAGESEPVMVECARRDFVGVIMPMRTDVLGVVVSGEFAEPPAWAQREPQPEVFAKEAVRA